MRALPFAGGQPRSVRHRDAESFQDERSINADTGSIHQIEAFPALAEETVERLDPRRQMVAFDPRDRGLRDPRPARQLSLGEAGLAPRLPEYRPCFHLAMITETISDEN